MATEPVELDSALLTQVRAVTDDVASFVAAAVSRELAQGDLKRLLNEMEVEAGPVPEEIAAEAERFWHAS